MSKFNLNDYETVKSRKDRFYQDHKDGRIIVNYLSQEPMEYALIEAKIYLSKEEQAGDLARATGYGFEVRDKNLSTSASGKQYESVNYSSWTENAEESAVGRALDNAGYSGNKKPSREEMEKVERMNVAMDSYNSPTPQTVPPTSENQIKGICKECGADMVHRSGVGQKGEWQGLFCPQDKSHSPVWL